MLFTKEYFIYKLIKFFNYILSQHLIDNNFYHKIHFKYGVILLIK